MLALLCMVVLFSGRAPVRADTPAASTFILKDGWEYAWQTDHLDTVYRPAEADWRPLEVLGKPESRSKARILWLRVPPSGGAFHPGAARKEILDFPAPGVSALRLLSGRLAPVFVRQHQHPGCGSLSRVEMASLSPPFLLRGGVRAGFRGSKPGPVRMPLRPGSSSGCAPTTT